MASASYGSLPFREQTEFFRRKVNLPTTGWTDIYAADHEHAFVVAGANRDAIVADFRIAVQKAIDGQSTLEDFRRDFDRIVAKYGWDYNGGRNWRSRVIYDTNLSASYAAGRWQQLQAAPYWKYVHQDWVQHPRPLHESWNGLVLERDNPWWRTHYPPNGWGCHCEVRGLWPADLRRLGKEGPDDAPEVKLVEHTIGANSELGPRTVRVPEGIDPGFEYAPGSSRTREAIPRPRPGPGGGDGGAGDGGGGDGGGAPPRADPPGPAARPGLPDRQPSESLPTPRAAPALPGLPGAPSLPAAALERLPATPVAQAASDFLAPLGATLERPAIVRDVIGERVAVGKELFTDAQGDWMPIDADQRRYLPLLAEALLRPDEIWARLEWLEGAGSAGRAAVRRRYIARFVLPGERAPVLAMFEVGTDGWFGITRLDARAQAGKEWRMGVRLYRRDEDGEDE
ncbi:PBECR2 nuclease fold domain-containing protein [Variovorax sp.]|uniref:PBECR2 nuclease fold domain-containing protein n=1 Tax=Variovorax sp. TaxID=1871043 RepID=UPI003BAAF126